MGKPKALGDLESNAELRDLMAEAYKLIRADEQIRAQLQRVNQRITELEAKPKPSTQPIQ